MSRKSSASLSAVPGIEAASTRVRPSVDAEESQVRPAGADGVRRVIDAWAENGLIRPRNTSAQRNRRARDRARRGRVVLAIEVDAAELAKELQFIGLLDDPWCEDRDKLARGVEKLLERLNEPMEGT